MTYQLVFDFDGVFLYEGEEPKDSPSVAPTASDSCSLMSACSLNVNPSNASRNPRFPPAPPNPSGRVPSVP